MMMLNLMLGKIARCYLRRNATPRNRLFVRNHLRKWCADREVVVSTGEPFRMAVSPVDYASYSIYFFGEYDPGMTSFMKTYLAPRCVTWDVGAERGWFTLLMATLVGGSGRVDSFEAYSPNYTKLLANIALNKLGNVFPQHHAVSDKPGVVHFVPPSDEVTHHVDFLRTCGSVGYVAREESLGTVPVEAITLDMHAEKHPLRRLDLVKIDIEGEELAALRGAERTIRTFRPILAVEYNKETALRSGSTVQELDAFLASLGYDRFHITGVSGAAVSLEKLPHLDDIPDVYNVYCFPAGDPRAPR